MHGSEFQEVYRTIAALEKRVKVLEDQMSGLPKVLDLTEAQEEALTNIRWVSEGNAEG